MPKLPDISLREAIRVFEKLGYEVMREGKHTMMSNGIRTLVIPRHNPVNPYTMGQIASAAGLTPAAFKALL